MKKWKGSLGAKIGAWIGITVSGTVFLGSIVGAYAIQEAGVYDQTEEELRRELFEDVAGKYAIQALADMQNDEISGFSDGYYRYGIIKAEKIDGLDLNDEATYVKRNFTQQVTADELYARSYEVGPDTVYRYSGGLFGDSAVVHTDPDMTVDEVYRVCYNVEDGIFYYETGNYFYPIRTVQLGRYTEDGTGIMVCTLFYDFDTKLYQNSGAELLGEEPTGKTEDVGPVEVPEEAADTGAAELLEETVDGQGAAADAVDSDNAADFTPDDNDAGKVLEQRYLALNMLDDTDFSYEQWEYLILDGRRYYGINDIRTADAEYMSLGSISAAQNYELGESNMLYIYDDAETNADETYWVVAILPENVELGWSNDLFMQANTLVTLAYGLRYGVYAILFVSLGLGVLFFAFLISAAGHRRGTEEIAATWLDKMPFDIYLCIAGLVELVFLGILVNLRYRLGSVLETVFFGFLALCMCWVALLSVLTLAVRVKRGKWWRNTVIWSVFNRIYRIFRMMAEHMSLLWKALLSLGILAGLEFFGILVLQDYTSGSFLFAWFVEKIAITLLVCQIIIQMNKLQKGSERIAEGDLSHQIDTKKMFPDFKEHGENLNSISVGMSKAVDERMKSERFKTELITNVSHDIKTPLTSIINYVDLLEKEELHNPTAEEYLQVLERQSGRLKKLIEDLMEASKASTGNLAVNLEKLEAGVSMVQIVGEFEEKTKANGLELLIARPEQPLYIMADSRHFWRVIDNLMNNICKYAQPQTRVYIDLEEKDERVLITFRNTSRYPLNISSEELMERFVRGDSSRNTEGSGLGISIAKSLMELMGGSFDLYVDGDLFKVVLGFALKAEK